jgi:hypothetical protein
MSNINDVTEKLVLLAGTNGGAGFAAVKELAEPGATSSPPSHWPSVPLSTPRTAAESREEASCAR